MESSTYSKVANIFDEIVLEKYRLAAVFERNR